MSENARPEDARPRVDVGVVTWNTRDLTVDALRRLLDSDQGVDVRLLVRDNGSTDGTADAIRRNVPEADLDAGAENLGFSGGVNTLIARSTAPWFFLLNSDAWPAHGALATLVTAAHDHPRAAAVVPRIETPTGRLQHSTHPFPSIRTAAITGFRWDSISRERADELFLEGTWMHDRPRRVDWGVGAAMLFPRDALTRVGGFDESFFFYAEDLEWCWRAHRLGYEIWFEPGGVIHHVESASGSQLYGGARTRAHMRNAFVFYRRAHGLAPAIGWWAMNVAGATNHLVGALRKRDRAAAANWRRYVSAQVQAPFVRERRPRR